MSTVIIRTISPLYLSKVYLSCRLFLTVIFREKKSKKKNKNKKETNNRESRETRDSEGNPQWTRDSDGIPSRTGDSDRHLRATKRSARNVQRTGRSDSVNTATSAANEAEIDITTSERTASQNPYDHYVKGGDQLSDNEPRYESRPAASVDSLNLTSGTDSSSVIRLIIIAETIQYDHY
jgi:hypothetical protein